MYTAVCVKECPSFPKDNVPNQLKVEYMKTTSNNKNYAADNIIFDTNGIGHPDGLTGATKDFTKISLSNTTEFKGQCFLEAASDNKNQQKVANEIKAQFNQGFGSYIRGIAEAWPVLAIMGAVTLFVTLIYIYLLRCITKPILYGSLLLIFLFLVGVTGYMFKVWTDIEDKDGLGK